MMKPRSTQGSILWSCCLALNLIVGAQLKAQSPSSAKFEVASIRRSAMTSNSSGPVAAPVVDGGPGTSNPTRITYRGMWLPALISMAFEINADQVSGPSWMRDERYDITANVPEGATRAQVNEMVRDLLVNRFGLQFHHGSKQGSGYALRVGSDGPKLKAASDVAESADAGTPRGGIGAADAEGHPTLPPSYKGIVGRGGNGRLFLTGQSATIPQIITWLQGPLGAQIVDETGLSGKYDIKISFLSRPQASIGPIPEEPAPTVFDAVQHLGLKLEKLPVKIDMVMIDRVFREPTAN